MEAGGLTKSAKKRNAKKARDAAFDVPGSEPAAPEPAKVEVKPEVPKAASAKAGAKAAAAAPQQPAAKVAAPAAAQPATKPAAKAAGKAAAKATAAPVAVQPAAAAAQPAKGGKAKQAPVPTPQPEPAAAPAPAAAKQQAAGKAASKAKGKAKAQAGAAQPKRADEKADPINYILDDGTGPEWDVKPLKPKKTKEEIAAEKVAAVDKEPASPVEGGKGRGKEGKDGKDARKERSPANQAYHTARASAAQQAIDEIMARKAPTPTVSPSKEEKAPLAEGHVQVSITVSESKIGSVVGRREDGQGKGGGKGRGATISMIEKRSGVERIDNRGTSFTITGLPESCEAAQAAIKEVEEKGYTAMAWEDFCEGIAMVPSNAIPQIIGSAGSVIRQIKKATGCEIFIPSRDGAEATKKKVKVTIVGSATKVEQVKSIINNLVTFQHDEVTHPGMAHEELDTEVSNYKFIIGAKGSELKHIQANFKVQVHVPRDGSNHDKVLVVGLPDDVTNARAYIERQIAEKAAGAVARAERRTAENEEDDY